MYRNKRKPASHNVIYIHSKEDVCPPNAALPARKLQDCIQDSLSFHRPVSGLCNFCLADTRGNSSTRADVMVGCLSTAEYIAGFVSLKF
jgi:hypothetical protein